MIWTTENLQTCEQQSFVLEMAFRIVGVGITVFEDVRDSVIKPVKEVL